MDPAIVVPSTQNHVAMENRELQSMKDRLLIETAELLGVRDSVSSPYLLSPLGFSLYC